MATAAKEKFAGVYTEESLAKMRKPKKIKIK